MFRWNCAGRRVAGVGDFEVVGELTGSREGVKGEFWVRARRGFAWYSLFGGIPPCFLKSVQVPCNEVVGISMENGSVGVIERMRVMGATETGCSNW